MDDTSPEIKRLLAERYAARSGAERLLMGCEMYNSSRTLVLASLPTSLTLKERRAAFFLRFYGNDFPPDQLKKILAWIKGQPEGARIQ